MPTIFTSKIGDYDDKNVDQNQRDFNDDVKRILNFGKYQMQIVTSPPTWNARRGEFALVLATSGTLMVCTTDNSTTWRSITSFSL